jgi:diguanylate cyclase (GGDEF)-like protein
VEKTILPVHLSVLKKIVDAAADPDTTLPQLSQFLMHDPSLAADMLRAANSALYGFPRTISTVDRAVILLGAQRVRNLVLCRAVTGMVPTERVKGFPLTRFWQASLRRAAAGLALARRSDVTKEVADTCFAVGLCQDLGLLVSMISDPRLAQRYATIIEMPSAARLYLESELVKPHSEVTADLFGEWGMPDDLAVPIRYHHWPEGAPEKLRPAARIANTAEAFADLFEIADKRTGLQLVRDGLTLAGLEVGMVEEIVRDINDETLGASEAFGITAPEPPSFDEIAAAASEAIASLQTSAERSAQDLQAVLLDKLRLVDQLNQANARLSLEALTDPLTDLPNRRAFEATLDQALAQAARQGSPLVVLMIDIDHFKRVNDEFGHPAGDRVLRDVAATVQGSLRKADVVARVGGEELAAVLPFTNAEGGQLVAERLRASVAALESDWQGRTLQVTVSIGGAAAAGPGRDVVDRADRALYDAKESGRNRVCWSDDNG